MSPRPPLRAALFDAGGTLVRLDYEWMAECVTSWGHPVEAAALRAGEVEGRRRFDASQPKDIAVYFEGLLAGAGVPAALRARGVAAFGERQEGPGLWVRPMEGARRALADARAAGLRVAVISNSDGRAEQHLRDAGLLADVEFVVDSERVGVAKPDPRIFRIALDRLGVPAAESVYIGDILCGDQVGAEAAGMHFVLICESDGYGAEVRWRLRHMEDFMQALSGWFELPAQAM